MRLASLSLAALLALASFPAGCASAPRAASAVDPVGRYEYTSSANGQPVSGVITIEPATGGGYTAAMSSSMTRDVLFRTVTVTGNAVTLETRTPASALVVRLRIDGSNVTGDWTMGAQTGTLRGTRRGAGR